MSERPGMTDVVNGYGLRAKPCGPLNWRRRDAPPAGALAAEFWWRVALCCVTPPVFWPAWWIR